MSHDILLSRPAFTDEDTLKLLEKFGREYFKSDDEKRKQITRKIQEENIIGANFTADAIGIRLNYLLAYYNSLKNKNPSKIKWKYYEAMSQVMDGLQNDTSSEEAPGRTGNKRGRPKSVKNTAAAVKEPLHKRAKLFLQQFVGTPAKEANKETMPKFPSPVIAPKEEPVQMEKPEAIQNPAEKIQTPTEEHKMPESIPSPTDERKKEETNLNNLTFKVANTSMASVARTETPTRCQIQQKAFTDIRDGVVQLVANSNSTLNELKVINKCTIVGNQIMTKILDQEKANGEKLNEINYHLKSIAGSFKVLFDIEKNRLQAHSNPTNALLKKK